MRRALATIILAAIIVAAMWAAGGVFPLTDRIYDDMEALYVLNGLAGLSPSRPWSEAEISRMLSRLDYDALDVESRALYDSLSSRLHSADSHLEASLALAPEIYMHTDESFDSDLDWAYGFNERQPFLKASIAAGLGPFHTYSELSYGYGRVTNGDTFSSLSDLLGDDFAGVGALVGEDGGDLRIPVSSAVYRPHFLFNLPPMDMLEIDIPRRTALLFSFEHIDFGYLRDRMQWGSAKIGNFIFDAHVEKMDRLFLKAQSNRFAFDYVIYFPETDLSNANQNDYGGKSRIMLAHMLSVRILDSLSLSVSENVMYSYSTAEAGYFNPAMIFHNLNNSRTLNAIAHLELEWVPLKGLRLYAQGVLDQATAPTESSRQAAAFGLDARIEYSWASGGAVSRIGLEGAYTSPYLYRRDGVDFLIFNRYSINDPYGKFPIFTFLGFPYGGDCIAIQLDASWRRTGSLELDFSLLAIVHGDVGIFSPHSSQGNDHYPDIKDKTPTGEPSLKLIGEAEVRMPFSFSVFEAELFLDAAFVIMGGKSDCQLAIGASLSV